MSQDSAAALSLLSLSMAASEAQPIPLDPAAAASANGNASASNGKHPAAPAHHRRLSSTGRRRRLSDARDAATRPLSVGAPGLSMAGLSLSTSATSASPTSAMSHHGQMAGVPASAPAKSGSTPMPIPAANGNSATGGKKKRGVDHKCEACSKIYRHPSCLIKHRWEHTPHWRTLSALPHPGPGGSAAGVLSKHAQVQLLEAAAILSHLSPDSETGTSLPEDRGMWPRWVSGGSLEGEEPVSASFGSVGGASEFGPSSVGGDYPPSSVGASEYGPSSVSVGGGSEYRSGGGPRLHDYEVPRGAEVRAGVVEVPHSRSYSHREAHSYGNSRHRLNGSGGWSVPRSVSVSASLSSSRSTPSDDEEAEDDDGDDGQGDADYIGQGRRGRGVWKREREEEFGFEVDLGGVREEDGEDEYEREEKERKGRYGKSERESLRWGGMEEMDDIDMDMD